MRILSLGIVALLPLALILGCGEEGDITVLFTGDDRGWVVPVG